VDQTGYGVDGIVVGARPELCHWEEVIVLYVLVEALGDDLLK
jgi:hypothetical protein